MLYAGIDGCAGSTLYLTDKPCPGCSKLIHATGLVRIVWPGGEQTTGRQRLG